MCVGGGRLMCVCARGVDIYMCVCVWRYIRVCGGGVMCVGRLMYGGGGEAG